MPKVVITGASGVLGSAVYNAFKSANQFEVIGLDSRASGEQKQLDLTDEAKLQNVIATELALAEGDWVIHCAAERRPDAAEKNPSGTEKINVSVPAQLAKLSASQKFTLVYISTGYVFDGASPPYKPRDATNPLQLYGRTKRDGENAILGVDGAKGVIVRVPVLYGPAPNNADSPINILVDVVKDQSGKTYKMDHHATRYPTNVVDIADFLVKLKGLNKPLPPIIHYSASEAFTRYEICVLLAKILGVPHKHIVPQPDAPNNPNEDAPRPANTQLDTSETQALLEGVAFQIPGKGSFEQWWTSYTKGN